MRSMSDGDVRGVSMTYVCTRPHMTPQAHSIRKIVSDVISHALGTVYLLGLGIGKFLRLVRIHRLAAPSRCHLLRGISHLAF